MNLSNELNRVFIFGDSWMEGQGTFEIETLTEWNNQYQFDPDSTHPNCIGVKRKKESWNKFFKERYNDIEVQNYAHQGSSNYHQFEKFNELLNFQKITDNDLILFGLTSKWRDTPRTIDYPFKHLFSNKSNEYYIPRGPDGSLQLGSAILNKPNITREGWPKSEPNSFTIKDMSPFEKYFLTTIFDENVYEKIAQTNYLFYQTYAKEHNLNILFFDLFDNYVNINKCKSDYIPLIDKNMYITFGKETYLEKLIQYELDNYDDMKADDYTVWEKQGGEIFAKFPKVGDDVHPNQFGYKLMFDDIVTYINKI